MINAAAGSVVTSQLTNLQSAAIKNLRQEGEATKATASQLEEGSKNIAAASAQPPKSGTPPTRGSYVDVIA